MPLTPFQAAEQENDQRRRLELAAAHALQNNNSEDVIKRNKLNQKRQQVTKNTARIIATSNVVDVIADQWAEIHSMILARTKRSW